MVDELTGLEVPPEIAAATLEAERVAAARLNDAQAKQPAPTLPDAVPGQCQRCGEHPATLIPFDEFERRIRTLRENGVRVYQDNLIRVQIDTFKRQPDPVPLAHETQST